MELRRLEKRLSRIRGDLLRAPREHHELAAVAFDALVFHVAGHAFGLPIAHVREVLRVVRLSPIPDAPAGVLGMLNLRGAPVPVLDLGRRVAGRSLVWGLDTPIVIAERSTGPLGLLVGRVDAVVPVAAGELLQAGGDMASHPAVAGIVDRGGAFLHVLDAELLLAADEGELLARAVASTDAEDIVDDDPGGEP